MWQAAAESPYDLDSKAKGDELQKLSVIETLPQLLAEDAHGCITRVLPKIQQTLPTASTEFHMAASVIFKQVLEQRLVSPTTFAEVFLQSILSSLGSREPVVSHAWLDTIIDVIELLHVDVVKREILPIAISEGRLSQSVDSRIMCCRLMGKIATRFDAESIKRDVLPTVQSLSQDVSSDVRACICLQLHLVAQNMGDSTTKLLPLIVELASDEESNVRQAAVQTMGLLLPHLKADTIVDIVVPLIKLTCENAAKSEDNVICVVAQEFGKLAQSTKAHLIPADKTWFIKYFVQIAQMGTPKAKEVGEDKAKHQEFSFHAGNANDRSVECRRSCAFNMPAMFLFASSASEGVNALIPTFRNLASDSYYMVRRTIACSLHEIINVLGRESGLIKPELIRLLKDDNEEVLQGLIPHVSGILENLLQHHLVRADQMESSTVDLGKALIQCEAQISLTNNWRLSALMLGQFEILPRCLSSDFIYAHLVPVVSNRVLYSRPLPVRLAAGRTLLVFLRYNLKSQQKLELRSKICNEMAYGSSCYLRMIFIRMMIEALTIFSSVYFKEYFCPTLLDIMDDPVANVRLKALTLAPTIKSCLRLPADKKLLSTLEMNVRNLKSSEKDRDVLAALNAASLLMDSVDVRVDGQPSPAKLSKYDTEDMKKLEEEKKLEAASSSGPGGKIGNTVVPNNPKKPNILKIPPGTTAVSSKSVASTDSPVKPNRGKQAPGGTESPKSAVPSKPPLIRQSSLSTSHVADISKTSSSNDNLPQHWSIFSSSNNSAHTTTVTPPPSTTTITTLATIASTTTTTTTTTTATSSSVSAQLWEKAGSSSHGGIKPMSYGNNDYPSTAQKVQCSCYELADRVFHARNNHHPVTSSGDHLSHRCSAGYIKTTSLFRAPEPARFPDFVKPFSLLDSSREECRRDLAHQLASRKYYNSNNRAPPPPPSYGSTPSSVRGLHYEREPYWGGFGGPSGLPALTFVDDEFMVDAGIRIPAQLTSSSYGSQQLQGPAKIPNLQDIIYRNQKMSFGGDRRFFGSSSTSGSFERSRPFLAFPLPKSYSLDYDYDPHDHHGDNDDEEEANPGDENSGNVNPSVKSGDRGRPRYNFEDNKTNKRNPCSSGFAEGSRGSKERPRVLVDRNRRANKYEVRLPGEQRHGAEVAQLDYGALRRLSILDVNHNQGALSKIPVRNSHVSGSRTAPVTRTSSPIRVHYTAGPSFKPEVRGRLRSSYDDVDKILCHQKF
ncbi:serine/threonine-protein phosphatase 4 regulatory subunit 4-like [Copidosoma floridanum]|uniref:serine/threonine-protein phosphatase 4 regulatory subunit 4-like n=1 Tax=Copidosoma floridanum TaxID=29053 RepID=UPI0006C9C1CB|nr:serine/threonine-protein phosphatase 4 regulatory subunit 4-like [Copidosoma floridanum]